MATSILDLPTHSPLVVPAPKNVGNQDYSFSHAPLLGYPCFMRWASHETANRTAHHRYCCYRESDRKLDPSRYTVRVFGPFLPLVCSFSSLKQYQFQKEEPPWVQNFMSAGCPMRQLNHSSPPSSPRTAPSSLRV